MVTDPSSGKKYYWHRETNETSWTLPIESQKDPINTNDTKDIYKVSIESARAAKQRMDKILENCGLMNNSKILTTSSVTTSALQTGTKRKGDELDPSDEKSNKKWKNVENNQNNDRSSESCS